MSAVPLRVLIVEDSPDDVTLLVRILRKGGFEPSFERVETEDAMRSALLEKPWDLVLADYRMPNFDGLRALGVLKESGLDIPFIIVSGTIGEEIAVDAMKAGASDYVMKGNLPRLIPAIERELKDAASREEKDKTEEALRLSEEHFRRLFEHSPIGVAIVGLDYRWISVNSTLSKMLGYTVNELTKLSFVDITHPDHIEENVGYAEQLKRGEIPSGKIAKRYITKNGEEIWVNLTTSLIRDNQGRQLYFLSMMEDITEPKRMEEQLLQSEYRYRSLVEDSFDGIFIQKGFTITFANSRLYEMLDYSPGELEGMDHWLIYHPESQDLIRRRATARMRGEQVISQYEVMLQKKDGAFFPAEISARMVQVDGEPGIQVWLRDISERRRSEEAQKLLATAIEQSIESVMITDRNGKIQYINPAFERISGYRKDEVIGRDTRFLKSDKLESSYYKDQLAAIRSGNPWKGRLLSQRKDGQVFYEDVSISPVRDSSGEIVSFVDVGHDVTENWELQMQLLQSQKMESLGNLAGGIAHDFNNLLQIVLGYSEIALQRKIEENCDYADLQQIYQAGKRGAELVKSLMTFSRKVEPQYVPVDLNQEVTAIRNLLSNTIPKTINIDLHLKENLESVNADPSQIGQVLMNLGVNARDAMPEGGTLRIETDSVQLDNEYCRSHHDAMPGSYVLLTVSDTGQGMDKETLSHIFEPFFTTKEKGKGTGLGLATVYGIVKLHDSHITCHSAPGFGTTFRIYFPAINKEGDSETPTIARPIPGGTETILLVDDEQVIRDLGATLLNRYGYKVITACNGKDALEIYQREVESISLAILDLIMPVMDGRKCLAEILRIDPHAKVIIASGYSEGGPANGDMATRAKGFVQKPYSMRQLLTTIRDILDAD
jgi:PAS domain S-box-containing protein